MSIQITRTYTILANALVLVAVVCLLPPAYASSSQGSICTAYAGPDQTAFHHLPWGIVNGDATGHYVTCPLTRTTSARWGAKILVEAANRSGSTASVTCNAFSFSAPGGPTGAGGGALVSATQTWTPTGVPDEPHEFLLNLSGFGNSNPKSNYSVWCFVPPLVDIYGVTLREAVGPGVYLP